MAPGNLAASYIHRSITFDSGVDYHDWIRYRSIKAASSLSLPYHACTFGLTRQCANVLLTHAVTWEG